MPTITPRTDKYTLIVERASAVITAAAEAATKELTNLAGATQAGVIDEGGSGGAGDPLFIPGPKGDAGARGLQGFGFDGTDGEDALTVPGPQGIQGVQGVPGIPGMDGAEPETPWMIAPPDLTPYALKTRALAYSVVFGS